MSTHDRDNVPTDFRSFARWSTWLLVLAMVGLAAAVDGVSRTAVTPRSALQRLNGWIGDWRGVGQPRRQSNQGAWIEHSGWVWDLSGPQPAIVQQVKDGKLLVSLRINYDPPSSEYVLTASTPEQQQIVYRGRFENDQLVVTSAGDAETPARRMTMTPRSDIRLVVLHEATEPGKEVYFRVAEVGYTRAGRRLAGSGGGRPQCVVTGGLGTIQVQYEDKTYYVCCTGCQQAFRDDPAKILQEYRERLEQERQAESR
ncbi:MAG: TRASH domain-containing protein [Planctomycetaceae bacterium]